MGRTCTCPNGYTGTGEGAVGCHPISATSGACSNNPCVHGHCQVTQMILCQLYITICLIFIILHQMLELIMNDNYFMKLTQIVLFSGNSLIFFLLRFYVALH